MLTTLLAFVVILGLLVFIHELGHFVMAKRAGLKVHEFGFGFPPRLFGIKRGETIYSINWIPLGGFVKIEGEDGTNANDPQSFSSKKASVRVLILAAGIIMNMVLAMVLFAIGYSFGIPQALPEGDLPQSAKVEDVSISIGAIAKGSPAEIASLQPLDQVLEFNGVPIDEISDLQAEVQKTLGQPSDMVIEREGVSQTISITPRTENPEDEGPLGVELTKTGIVSFPWYKSIWYGIRTAVETLGLIVVSIYGIIRDAFVTGNVDGDAFTGPVGIAVLTGQFARQGIVYLLWFAAFLSVNLAFINAIPFPALDGGRILFVIIEKLRRGKKVKQSTENLAHMIGFGLLLLLVIVVTFKDVVRFQDSFVRLWERITGIFS